MSGDFGGPSLALMGCAMVKIRNAFWALGAAMLLAWPLSISAQTRAADEREAPEVMKLTLRGVKAFDRSELQQSISTEASHCRSLILTPICWITKSKAVYAHFFLDRTEFAPEKCHRSYLAVVMIGQIRIVCERIHAMAMEEVG